MPPEEGPRREKPGGLYEMPLGTWRERGALLYPRAMPSTPILYRRYWRRIPQPGPVEDAPYVR